MTDHGFICWENTACMQSFMEEWDIILLLSWWYRHQRWNSKNEAVIPTSVLFWALGFFFYATNWIAWDFLLHFFFLVSSLSLLPLKHSWRNANDWRFIPNCTGVLWIWRKKKKTTALCLKKSPREIIRKICLAPKINRKKKTQQVWVSGCWLAAATSSLLSEEAQPANVLRCKWLMTDFIYSEVDPWNCRFFPGCCLTNGIIPNRTRCQQGCIEIPFSLQPASPNICFMFFLLTFCKCEAL